MRAPTHSCALRTCRSALIMHFCSAASMALHDRLLSVGRSAQKICRRAEQKEGGKRLEVKS